MSEQDFTINDWMAEVGEPLPEDWKIVVTVEHGLAAIELVDPQGEIIEFNDDDLDPDDMIRLRVNHARNADGLDDHFDESPEIEKASREKSRPKIEAILQDAREQRELREQP